ncbi:hypothetical protein EYF80_037934 [Liparis tanakae]|uniref:Uncharacterized protein n=1 Tax=Liparis tanakae TaxID=230148 RepID=A0A4Z2GE72_9TELE|nr:hypothetical protein EYF80_037934 [Liparis tanakae]
MVEPSWSAFRSSSHHLYVYHLTGSSRPPPPLSFLRCRGPLQVPDLLDQIVLLVAELLILRSVGLEVAQELHEFGLVLQQDVQHGLSLVGVCNEYLKTFFFLKYRDEKRSSSLQQSFQYLTN